MGAGCFQKHNGPSECGHFQMINGVIALVCSVQGAAMIVAIELVIKTRSSRSNASCDDVATFEGGFRASGIGVRRNRRVTVDGSSFLCGTACRPMFHIRSLLSDLRNHRIVGCQHILSSDQIERTAASWNVWIFQNHRIGSQSSRSKRWILNDSCTHHSPRWRPSSYQVPTVAD